MRLTTTLVLLGVCAAWLHGADKKPAVDNYGDPLPEGALARLGTIRLHHPWGRHLAFSPDGKLLASEGGGTICVWKISDGALLSEWKGKPDALGLAFSADGKAVVLLDGDGTIRRYDWKEGRELKQSKVPDWSAREAALGPDGEVVFYRQRSEKVALYRAGTDKAEVFEWKADERPWADERDRARLFAVSADGKRCAFFGRRERGLLLLDLPDGKKAEQLAKAEERAVLAFSADGKQVAAASDRKVVVHDLANARTKEVKLDPGQIKAVALSPDGKTLAVIGVRGFITLADWQTGRASPAVEELDVRTMAVAFLLDGRILTGRQGLDVWEWKGGKPARKPFAELPHDVYHIRVSPKGDLVACTGYSSPVYLWDAASGKQLTRMDGNKDGNGHMAFSPDGKRLVTASCELRVWDVVTGKEVCEVLKDPWGVNDLAFSPDGKTLAVPYSGTGYVRVLEAATLKERYVLKCGNGGHGVVAVAISPCGRVLASSSSYTDVIHLWETDTGKALGTLPVGKSWAIALAFTPDGRTLISASGNGTICFWEMATWKAYRTLSGHKGFTHSMSLSADARTLVTAASDQTALVWPVREDVARLDDLKAEQLDALWDDLASDDAVKGYKAVLGLTARPKQAVELIEKSLRTSAPGAKEIGGLIEGLSSDKFATRRRSEQQLLLVGKAVLPQLEQALTKATDADLKKRLEGLKEEIQRNVRGGDQRRLTRALDVLERIGDEAARNTLKRLSAALTDPAECVEAQQTLDRLTPRKKE